MPSSGPAGGKPPRILVTGGAGFVGSNLVHRLVAAGADVSVVDNLLTGHPRNLPAGVALERMDCGSPEFAAWALGTKWDLAFHFAGASSAPLFDEQPARLSNAVAAFQNVLEAARASRCKVAFASTSSLYARSPRPSREDMPIAPGTLYEASKYAMEQVACAYWHRYGVPSAAFRFFSVYGPREEAKGRFANIVSQFLWSLRSGEAPVIYGDGSQTRDFTHVDDLLDAVQLATERTQDFQVYNVGTGVETSFNDVVRLLNDALGTDIEPKHVPNPVANYVAATQADAGKVRALGWRPKVVLQDGIRRLAMAVPA